MRIFISWSGDKSKAIAEIFRDWLPAVLQSVKPYFTPSDIEKGSRWNSDISKKLEECKMGLFILTKDNLLSPWLMFEAGAVSKSVENSKVCPILFGIENSDIKGPLTQFQASSYNKIDIKKIVKSINSELADNKLEDRILDEVFDTWWPKLEQKINAVKIEDKDTESEIRDDRELLEEILGLVRFTAKKSNISAKNINISQRSTKYDIEKLEDLISNFVTNFEALFDWDWDHTNGCLRDDLIEYFISPSGTFINPNVVDEGNDWGNRPGLLNSYRKIKEFMSEYDISTFDIPGESGF
jgi:hypothetical protein